MSCAENRGTPTSLRGTPSVTAPHGLRPGRRRQGAAGPACRVHPTRLGCRRGADGARTGRGRGAGGTCCGTEAWRWVGTGMLLSGKGFLRPTAPPLRPRQAQVWDAASRRADTGPCDPSLWSRQEGRWPRRRGRLLGGKVTSWSVRTSAGREGRRRLRGQKVDEGGGRSGRRRGPRRHPRKV